MGKIKSFLSDSQLGDVTLMFLKFLVFFSLKVLIKEVLIKKKNNNNKKERMQLEEDQEEMMGNCFIL